MDLYTLDAFMQKSAIIDDFQSLIWTDRWQTIGDFELDIQSNPANRALLTKGTWLMIRESDRYMIIEDLSDATDADGNQMLKVTGRSLEKILQDRVARAAMTTSTANPTWNFNATPQSIMKTIFDTVCVNGGQSSRDIIPGVKAATMPGYDIPFQTAKITANISPDSLDAVFNNLCSIYNLGYRLIAPYDFLNGETPWFSFDIFTGNDYSSNSGIDGNVPIIFSPDLDNLENTTEYSSVQGSKNTAYVITPNGSAVVYGATTPHDISGFDRRVLYVDASDITETDPTLLAGLMTQRGQEQLAQNSDQYAFDGDLKQYNNGLRYLYDYNLGDRVDLRNVDGIVSTMRVSEHIYVSDSNGDRSYPTLTVETVIEPDSWAGSQTEHWIDAGTDETWATS